MVNKIIRFLPFVLVITFVVIILFSGNDQPPIRDIPPPQEEKKVILTTTMIPVDDSPGEFILEHSNGNRELLKKDGTRVPLQPVKVKK